jgi:carbamoyl-phosphate synthase small subunit
VYASGLIIRDLPLAASNWRCKEDLSTYLRRNNLVAIGDIDTRRLTRLLRTKGAQNGCIQAGAASTRRPRSPPRRPRPRWRDRTSRKS